jgi:hypothetical protein
MAAYSLSCPPPCRTMPHISDKQIWLDVINQVELKVAEKHLETLQDDSGCEFIDSILFQDYIYVSPIISAFLHFPD